MSRVELLKAFLATVFEEASAQGLTKQDVLLAFRKYADIFGEPNLPSIELPERAPELYPDRKDKTEDPVTFFRRVWSKYAEAGILYLEDIERLGDSRLVPAVRNYCHRKGMVAKDILPPPIRSKVDEIVARLSPDEMDAAHKWAMRQQTAKWRAEHG
jgi:hypothetical protein